MLRSYSRELRLPVLSTPKCCYCKSTLCFCACLSLSAYFFFRQKRNCCQTYHSRAKAKREHPDVWHFQFHWALSSRTDNSNSSAIVSCYHFSRSLYLSNKLDALEKAEAESSSACTHSITAMLGLHVMWTFNNWDAATCYNGKVLTNFLSLRLVKKKANMSAASPQNTLTVLSVRL